MIIVKLYDKDIIGITLNHTHLLASVVKSLQGSRYHAKHQLWTMPLDGFAVNSIEVLKRAGFFVTSELLERIDALKCPVARELPQSPIIDRLMPFQREAVHFLINNGSSLLALDVGLGKTITSLTASQILAPNGHNLVVCPAVLKRQWQSEIQKFFPSLSTLVIEGDKAERKTLYASSNYNFIIINYELLRRDFDDIKNKLYDVIIADEAHKVSNPRAQQSKRIKTLKSKYRFALTGTPIPNKPENLWNVLDFVKPLCLGKYYTFVQRYCQLNPWGGVANHKNLDELARRIQPFMFRRRKVDVLPELPDIIEEDITFDLSVTECALYDKIRKQLLFDIERESISKLSSSVQLQNALTRMLRLQELCDSLALLGDSTESSKTSVLIDLIRDLQERGEGKVVVYTKFSRFADMLEIALKEFKVLKITGDVKDRQPIIDKFNEENDHYVMVITDAASHGVNLQHQANIQIFCEQPYSIAKKEQVMGRTHRIGQGKQVVVYNLLATMDGKATMDGHFQKLLNKKAGVAESVLGWREIKEILL